ncbi:hypothetical protein AB0L42_29135 [Streptomyces sp. NPDC052287]|uniref:hypothetical protein n=1 Tax=Streptomyces sp. NPDC052287 TaxID=3154950 RepID=UPI003426A5AA
MSSANKWMVGFRFHSEVRGVVEHFYLVDGTAGSAGAHRAAAQMAGPASERAGRREVQRVQIQRVVTDLLGNVGLSAPIPGLGAMPAANSVTSPIEVAR